MQIETILNYTIQEIKGLIYKLFCVNRNKAQKIKNRGNTVEIKIIGPIEQRDFNYIRKSDIIKLDLNEVAITETGNNEDYESDEDCKHKNSYYYSEKLKSAILPKDLKILKNLAFCYCTSLASIDTPSSVASIGDYAFSDCESLASMNMADDINSIDIGGFSCCRLLATINLPSSVISIGESAFVDCELLFSINIPSNATTIGKNAFTNCYSLIISVEEEANFILKDSILYTRNGV